jgi:hypothetical protein
VHARPNQHLPLLTDQQADVRARNALAALVFPLERSTRMRELKHLGADAKALICVVALRCVILYML